MKTRIRAEKIFKIPSIYEVDEDGYLAEYLYDQEALETDEIYYRLETKGGEYLASVDSNEYNFTTVKEYARYIEGLDDVENRDDIDNYMNERRNNGN